MKVVFSVVLAASCVVMSMAVDYQQYVEPAAAPTPYNFNIRAGRFPGNVDRQHVESGDGAGNVQGSYSYIGPRQQIRTVDYVADANGFHPTVYNPVQDTPAVAQAKQRHAELFQKIANDHVNIGQQRASQAQGHHNQGQNNYNQGQNNYNQAQNYNQGDDDEGTYQGSNEATHFDDGSYRPEHHEAGNQQQGNDHNNGNSYDY